MPSPFDQRKRWIDPSFSPPPDPNDSKMYGFVGVWGLLRPSTTHVARRAFFGSIMGVLMVAMFLPMAVVEGLLRFSGMGIFGALLFLLFAGMAFQQTCDFLLANYPGALATLRMRVVARLVLLSCALVALYFILSPSVRWIETVTDSELQSIYAERQDPLQRFLMERGLRVEDAASLQKATHNLAASATSRFLVLTGLLFIALSTAALWSERRLRGWGLRLETKLREPPSSPSIATIAHLTDIHLTLPDASLVEGGPSPNDSFEKVWSTADASLSDADHILVTGDITDTGAAEEWYEFFRLVGGLIDKLILVPGNHDLNIVDRNKWYVEGESGFRRTNRLLRMIAAIDNVQGRRAQIVVGSDLVKLGDHLDPYRQCLQDFTEKPHRFMKLHAPSKTRSVFYGRKRPLDIAYSLVPMLWDEIFPHAIEDADRKIVFLVLNSNALAGNIIQNALGVVGNEQLTRLRELFLQYRGWSKVVLLHHHLALPPFNETLLHAFFARLMVLINAADVLSLLLDEQLVVFHGHRHIAFRGTIGDKVQIIAGPSASLVDEVSGSPPTIDRYQLHRGNYGGLVAVPLVPSATR